MDENEITTVADTQAENTADTADTGQTTPTTEELIQQLTARVAVLEAIVGEEEYELRYSGEQVDEILDRVGTVHYGTMKYVLSELTSTAVIQLNLPFTPKLVVATVRSSDLPNPYQTFCSHVFSEYGRWYMVLCMGSNNGSNLQNVPRGTYYIDYIAIE